LGENKKVTKSCTSDKLLAEGAKAGVYIYRGKQQQLTVYN